MKPIRFIQFFGPLVAGLVVFSAFPVDAQVSMSPRGSVSQTMDGTKVTVDYARPRLRIRDMLFGGQIYWGHIWTPGANDATTIEFNRDIKIQDVDVPAGKYSMWMVVQPGDWEVWLDPNWDQFHVPEPPKPADGYFFSVKPDTTAPVTETLTFDFITLENFGGVLQLRWHNRLVDMDIKVPPSFQTTVTPEMAAPYIGNYTTEVFKNEWIPEDYSFEMTISQEGDELLETAEFFFEFDLDAHGMASSFEMRTPKDEIWMHGIRK